jgi:hypothetical protein
MRWTVAIAAVSQVEAPEGGGGGEALANHLSGGSWVDLPLKWGDYWGRREWGGALWGLLLRKVEAPVDGKVYA